MAKGKKTGGGTRKGAPNKVTAELKDMIRSALDDSGGQKYLARQAEENPSAFLTLLGKILPKDILVGGDPKKPIQVNHALNPAALQAVDDLIRAVTGVRANSGDAQADSK